MLNAVVGFLAVFRRCVQGGSLPRQVVFIGVFENKQSVVISGSHLSVRCASGSVFLYAISEAL